jgi:hypothetical protein
MPQIKIERNRNNYSQVLHYIANVSFRAPGIFWHKELDSVGTNYVILRVIAGFHREVAENGAFQGYYAAISGNFLPTFRETYQSHP